MPNYLFIVTAIIGWALWAFLSKIAMSTIHPLMVQFVTYVVGIVSAAIYFIFIYKFQLKWNVVGIGWATIAAVFGILGSSMYMFASSQKEVSSVLPLAAAYPVLVCILAILFLGETFTLNKLIGLALVTAGVYVLDK